MRTTRWTAAVTYLLILALAGAAVVGMIQQQERTDQAVLDRFAARASLSGVFFSTYAAQLMDREVSVATADLGGKDPTASFDRTVRAFGFQAAVLLDGQGRALAVAPAAPALLGAPIASKYAHLTSAVQGERAVSVVVPSAVQAVPVVAFAVPFNAAEGRRVLSGAFRVDQTPLRAYLNGMSTLQGFRAYVIDTNGQVVAASGKARSTISSLRADDPPVASVVAEGQEIRRTPDLVVAQQSIPGTPWVMVTAIPTSVLLATARGSIPFEWAVLTALTIFALLAGGLWHRLLQQRSSLRVANGRLADLADRDVLTGMGNRRFIDAALRGAHRDARGSGAPLSVLLVDVDHFKRVNDTYGHAAGDEVLIAIAGRIDRVLRVGDAVGRWGGEEFLIVLAGATPEQAATLAERIRATVGNDPVSTGSSGDVITTTVSVGCYTGQATKEPEVFVAAADRALYLAKDQGRDQVVALPEQLPLGVSPTDVTARS